MYVIIQGMFKKYPDWCYEKNYNILFNLLRIGPSLKLHYLVSFPLMEAFPEFLFGDSHKLLDCLDAFSFSSF